jgi:hypothetical protein
VSTRPTCPIWSPEGRRLVVDAAQVDEWVGAGWSTEPPPDYVPPAPEPQRERRGTTRDGSPPVEPKTMLDVLHGVPPRLGLVDADYGREGPGARFAHQLDLKGEAAPSKIRRL